jgi:hypothetical protein
MGTADESTFQRFIVLPILNLPNFAITNDNSVRSSPLKLNNSGLMVYQCLPLDFVSRYSRSDVVKREVGPVQYGFFVLFLERL